MYKWQVDAQKGSLINIEVTGQAVGAGGPEGPEGRGPTWSLGVVWVFGERPYALGSLVLCWSFAFFGGALGVLASLRCFGGCLQRCPLHVPFGLFFFFWFCVFFRGPLGSFGFWGSFALFWGRVFWAFLCLTPHQKPKQGTIKTGFPLAGCGAGGAELPGVL